MLDEMYFFTFLFYFHENIYFFFVYSYLSQAMIKDTYPADIARLEYSVNSTERGFQIALQGIFTNFYFF